MNGIGARNKTVKSVPTETKAAAKKQGVYVEPNQQAGFGSIGNHNKLCCAMAQHSMSILGYIKKMPLFYFYSSG
ncbi:hypothetical protein [Candidatus Cardinium hertigii]|uniref:Uncharacterized protein n=1 Tax=Candidatus Cardinium hertigii TaxID=247481 RepID=A0A2Z3LA52_9BACT|nr:hypothetical protein [Candidatus Cardinium hertigii]AWN82219.1 hypothetical protein DK880_00921 [Candidatus Cardinium hertigii]